MKACSESSGGDRPLGVQTSQYSIEANVDLWFDGSHILNDPGSYRKLIKN